ncbi:MAG: hypothetical protein ABIG61_06520 [Planctomycetota bacterium]
MTDAQIFQVFGILYLAIGAGVFINPDFYKKLLTDYTENRALIYVSGIAILAIGYLLVTFHNTWVRDWPVIITILGWMTFVKGLFLLVLPSASIKICNALKGMTKFLMTEAIFIIILGILLVWLGFFVA